MEGRERGEGGSEVKKGVIWSGTNSNGRERGRKTDGYYTQVRMYAHADLQTLAAVYVHLLKVAVG